MRRERDSRGLVRVCNGRLRVDFHRIHICAGFFQAKLGEFQKSLCRDHR
jgi:hypothetical protein